MTLGCYLAAVLLGCLLGLVGAAVIELFARFVRRTGDLAERIERVRFPRRD